MIVGQQVCFAASGYLADHQALMDPVSRLATSALAPARFFVSSGSATTSYNSAFFPSAGKINFQRSSTHQRYNKLAAGRSMSTRLWP